MKTCIEITDALLDEIRDLGAREGTTVRALVEEGLRRVLEERHRAAAFKLRRVTFGGRGMRREVEDAPWGAIRDLAYRGRGA